MTGSEVRKMRGRSGRMSVDNDAATLCGCVNSMEGWSFSFFSFFLSFPRSLFLCRYYCFLSDDIINQE